MKWGEDQTYQFVKIYFKHEHLWNSTDEKYKAKNLKIKSYHQIISEFKKATGIELNIVELKIKIKNLRSTYIQELAKIKRKSSPDCMYKSSLKWFSSWHEHYASTKKNEVVSYDLQDPIEDSSEVWVSQTNNVDTNVDPFQEEDDYDLIPEVEHNYKYKHNLNQVKKKNIRSSSVEFSDRNFRSSMDSSDLLKEDEFDIYGKYIASQLRKMDLQKALTVQLGIQNVMSEARMSELMNKH